MHEEVCRLANVLKGAGARKGDRITLYLPMIPEAAFALLACARIGAIHSVVFGGFSPDALAGRIQDCDSTLVITADEGRRAGKTVPLKANVDKALERVDVQAVLVIAHTSGDVNMKEGRDHWYDALSADVTSLMSSIDITQGTYVPSPIDTLSVELVGIGSGSRGTFTTGAGAMNLYPSGGQTYAWTPAVQVSGGNPYYPVPPEFGFTQQEMGNHTAEQSNIDWSNPAFQEDGSWLQLWQYGSYPVTGIKSNTVIITVT